MHEWKLYAFAPLFLPCRLVGLVVALKVTSTLFRFSGQKTKQLLCVYVPFILSVVTPADAPAYSYRKVSTGVQNGLETIYTSTYTHTYAGQPAEQAAQTTPHPKDGSTLFLSSLGYM